MTLICEPFGPLYPDIPAARKYRKAARHGLSELSAADRFAYGLAVETTIKARQRAELQRELPEHRINCASGTSHSCGLKISAAVRAQHRTSLLAAPGIERRKRTDAMWQEMYDAAMKARHEAQS